MRGTLPRVPIDDIVIAARENDLVLGTHGRSIIILDDITPLERIDPAVLTSDVHLFAPRVATQTYQMRALPSPAAGKFAGPNPAYGALITYYLKSDPPPAAKPSPTPTNGDGGAQPETKALPEPKVAIEVLDATGALVRRLEGPDRAGINRVAWDLRYPLPFTLATEEETWFGPPRGTLVLPGAYTVRLRARGRELTERVEVRVDPRARTTPEALRARFDASQRLAEVQRAFFDGQKAVQEIDKELQRLSAAAKASGTVPAAVEAPLKAAEKEVADLKERFKSGWGGPQFQLLDVAGQFQASTSAPTEAQLRSVDHLRATVTEGVQKVNATLSKTLPELQQAMKSAGLGEVVKAVKPPQGQ
jgi:hypothetical protein